MIEYSLLLEKFQTLLKENTLKFTKQRELVLDNIIVRSGPEHKFSLHIDTDEANAAGIRGKVYGELVK